MSGYRSRASAKSGRPEGDDLVEGMVKQFADPFAFLRELVQNAIDAGATKIRVDVDNDAHGRPFISVEDDGAGMTLAIIEGPLLTLFSTSKEGQEGKIGKYGVGFMSVFALEPIEVWIETHRSEGHHFVRLLRDHSYTIEERPKRRGHGTKVSLVLRGDREPSEVRDAALAALRRYCRHVRAIVELVGPTSTVRIGEPLTIVAPCTVSLEKDGYHVVVAYSAGTSLLGETGPEGSGDYAGFFNRGLMLFESSAEEEVERDVRFKIDSARLGHTLSRDSVRRDAALARGLSLVRSIVEDDLAAALERELLESVGDGKLDARGVALLRCAAEHLKPKRLHLPLVVPLDGRSTMPLSEVSALSPKGEPILVAETSDPIANDLARNGVPVVRSSACNAVLGALVSRDVVQVEAHFDVLRPLDIGAIAHGEGFVRALRSLLARAKVEVDGVILGVIDGAPLARAFLVMGKRPRHYLSKAQQARRRRPSVGDSLFIDTHDELYGRAIARYADGGEVTRRQVIALVARSVQLDLGLRASEKSRDALFGGPSS